MAYLKQWSPRSHRDLELQVPELLPGPGHTVRGDAMATVDHLPAVDLMYLDPPYNQHRYFTNYHVWETLVRWDEPEHYGIACKRVDARDDSTSSVFNSKLAMPAAMADLLARARAEVLVVSYNDESWISPRGDDRGAAGGRPRVRRGPRLRLQALRRGADRRPRPTGEKVGEVKRLRNVEYLFLAGDRARVRRCVRAVVATGRPVDRVAAKDLVDATAVAGRSGSTPPADG